jgi:terminase large subunit-like protein
MNILQAINDPNLFRSYLGDNLDTWRPWLTALGVLYGIGKPRTKSQHSLITECTGRTPAKLPKSGFNTALFLTGRRSGKSRIAAAIGAYEAILAGHDSKLSKGEKGVVLCASPTKSQSRVVRDYIRSIFEVPLLANELANETQSGFELKSGIRVEILAGDWRTVRGYTLVAAIIDEICFFGHDAESKVKSDSELVRAIKPGLASIGGKLIGISSPYAQMGWSYSQYKRNHANDKGRVLVWNCPSRTMNTTLPQSTVDEALQEDYQSAKAEYLGEFRDDVASLFSRDMIENCVVPQRLEILPNPGTRYLAFVDVSGGRSDGSALAIAHRDQATVILDAAYHWPAPHDPQRIVACMCEELRRYNIRRIVGDNYSAEFVVTAFKNHGVRYEKSKQNKSELYLELLPRVTSKQVALLDIKLLVDQLASLERRTRSGGRDSVDHIRNGHDDLANAVAGAVTIASKKRSVVGAFPQSF